mgnify:FL=1
MANKITVRSTAIIINDYEMGDCPQLENKFYVWDPIRHKKEAFGMYYDEENHKLYIPAGQPLWQIRRDLEERYYDSISSITPIRFNEPIKMKSKPRDEEQFQALQFMCGLGEYEDNQYAHQLSVNLQTGKGKTFCTIGTLCFFGVKAMIITASNTLLTQWKDEILKYTTLTDKQIVQIKGSDNINWILHDRSKLANNACVYLCSHGTLSSYGKRYGWDKVYDLFEFLGIGIKAFDECHSNFNNMLMIDFFSNVEKTYYISATPARSDWQENRIFQRSYSDVPAINLFKEDSDPHTNYIALKYNSCPSANQISACRHPVYGLNRPAYMEYITQNQNFYKMMHIVINDFVIPVRLKGGKVLIYIGTNEGILRVYKWLAEKYPQFLGEIGIFTSISTKEEKMRDKNKGIILSTTKSAGAGEDIKGLKLTIVAAEPFRSSVLAQQTLGRTRDNNTFYLELVDLGFKKIRDYYYAKLPVFNKYAESTSDSVFDRYELSRRAEIIEDNISKKGESPISLYDERIEAIEQAKDSISNEE